MGTSIWVTLDLRGAVVRIDQRNPPPTNPNPNSTKPKTQKAHLSPARARELPLLEGPEAQHALRFGCSGF